MSSWRDKSLQDAMESGGNLQAYYYYSNYILNRITIRNHENMNNKVNCIHIQNGEPFLVLYFREISGDKT